MSIKLVELKTVQPVKPSPRELLESAFAELPEDTSEFVLVADTSEGVAVIPINIDILAAMGLLETGKVVLTNEYIKI